MLSKYSVRIRFGIVFLNLISLTTAILNAVDALFAGVLRDTVIGTATDHRSHATEILAFQVFTLHIAIISAVATTLVAILGLATAINPTRLEGGIEIPRLNHCLSGEYPILPPLCLDLSCDLLFIKPPLSFSDE
jgi:hypothetical protein